MGHMQGASFYETTAQVLREGSRNQGWLSSIAQLLLHTWECVASADDCKHALSLLMILSFVTLSAMSHQEDVWRLEIKVDDVLAVKEGQASSNIQGNALAPANFIIRFQLIRHVMVQI